MERLDNWRAATRGYIAEHLDQRHRVGDLFDLFGANMPLHHATRMWVVSGRAEIGITPHEDMRWRCFQQFLHNLSLTYEPIVDRRSRMTINTVAIPALRPCVGCGKPYFGYNTTKFHDQKCKRATQKDPPFSKINMAKKAAEAERVKPWRPMLRNDSWDDWREEIARMRREIIVEKRERRSRYEEARKRSP